MKRLLIGLLIAAAVTGGLFGLFYLTGGEAWQRFLDEKLWPAVATVVSATFSIYALILPVIERLKKGTGTMVGAAAEFSAARAALATSNEENKELRARVKALEEEQEIAKREQAEARKRFGRLCRVFAVGWGADERMVKSGAAREMFKIVEEFEKGEAAADEREKKQG